MIRLALAAAIALGTSLPALAKDPKGFGEPRNVVGRAVGCQEPGSISILMGMANRGDFVNFSAYFSAAEGGGACVMLEPGERVGLVNDAGETAYIMRKNGEAYHIARHLLSMR